MSKEQAWSELNRTGLIFNIFVNGLPESFKADFKGGKPKTKKEKRKGKAKEREEREKRRKSEKG